MENKSISLNFPIKLLKFELKEYLEYIFKVYIKKEDNEFIIYGNQADLQACQEHAEYFKSVDSQFLLHLNEYSKEALTILSLKLLFQSKCKVLMAVDNNVLYIFGQLYNVTCIYNYFCDYTNKIENEFDFDISEIEETDLNVICRTFSIKLPDQLLKKSKIFIYFILKYRDDLFVQFDEHKRNELIQCSENTENSNLLNVEIHEKLIFEDNRTIFDQSENDASSLLQPSQEKPQKYRTVIIDGSNVAFQHGNGNFSALGIKLAVEYFVNRGNVKVYALLPRHRQPSGSTIFPQLELADHLKFTPSRIINHVRETPYDDRFILDAAIATNGVVVSNDQYRDLMSIDKYKDIICKRLIPYTFIEDHIIIPNDPRGPNGPSLDDLLIQNPEKNMKKSPKKHQNQFKRPRPLQAIPKTNSTHSPIRQFKSPHKPAELRGPQIDLYKRAYDVMPGSASTIQAMILSNPNCSDLNTILNLVIMAEKK